jgi:thymidylate kinase
MKLRNDVFEVLINALNNYKYCILRNYEDLPEFNNDIDILIEKGHSQRILLELISELKKVNVIFLYKAEFSCLAVYFYDLIANQFIHIDLFEQLKWKVFEYLPGKLVLESRVRYKNFYIPAPYYEMHELVLTRLVYQGKIKDVYKKRIFNLYNKIPYEVKNSDEYGMLENISKQDWSGIEKRVNLIRIGIIFKNFIKPLELIHNIYLFFQRIIYRFIKPPGLFIAFLGVDGSGKTTQIENIANELRGIYSEKIRLFHFRPEFRYKEMQRVVFQNPHNQKRITWIRSILKQLYYVFIYNWGYYTQILPLLSRNGLVLFDRYYQDLLIDPIRYRYKGARMAKIVSHFIPKPDLYICLIGNENEIYKRKREISIKEIIRQQEQYSVFLPDSNTYYILADRDPQTITNDIKQIVIKFLSSEND